MSTEEQVATFKLHTKGSKNPKRAQIVTWIELGLIHYNMEDKTIQLTDLGNMFGAPRP